MCVGWGFSRGGNAAVNVQPQKPSDPPTSASCQQDILSGCILGSLIFRPERSMPKVMCVHRESLTTCQPTTF